ncbi:MAG: YeeE/YedE family protein [Planktomarina sp.]|nr:YeeE/YedE family protein [Planktomarina sp.]
METEFTPLLSLLGGGLIGTSAVLLMATHGRIAGISGILSRMLPPSNKDQSLPQSLIFIIGLLLTAPIWIVFNGQAPLQTVSNNLPLLALAGVLVGFGSVLSNGCTSGHGVCGISRLSGRSIVATLTFMSTSFIAVLLLRHVFGS